MAEALNRVAGPCPDLETIAAFLDGRLRDRERARVVEHLAACEECYAVFRESAQTSFADGFAQRPATQWSWGRTIRPIGALAAAAALAFVVVPWMRTSVGTRPDLAELVSAVGTDRTIEPRLSGGFAYGPLQSPTRGESSTLAPDLRIAAARIEKAAAADRTPQALAALGAAYALTDKPDESVSALESATRDAPAEATYWSDLAAAYIVRAHRERRLEDLTRAVDAADRATRIAPALREAWFNRALAIEQIGGLREQAKRAWEDYVKVDAASEWSAEAKRHIAALSGQSRATWNDQPDSLRRTR